MLLGVPFDVWDSKIHRGCFKQIQPNGIQPLQVNSNDEPTRFTGIMHLLIIVSLRITFSYFIENTPHHTSFILIRTLDSSVTCNAFYHGKKGLSWINQHVPISYFKY